VKKKREEGGRKEEWKERDRREVVKKGSKNIFWRGILWEKKTPHNYTAYQVLWFYSQSHHTQRYSKGIGK